MTALCMGLESPWSVSAFVGELWSRLYGHFQQHPDEYRRLPCEDRCLQRSADLQRPESDTSCYRSTPYTILHMKADPKVSSIMIPMRTAVGPLVVRLRCARLVTIHLIPRIAPGRSNTLKEISHSWLSFPAVPSIITITTAPSSHTQTQSASIIKSSSLFIFPHSHPLSVETLRSTMNPQIR